MHRRKPKKPRKRPDIAQQQRQVRHRTKISTPTLAEEFPEVEELIIEMNFMEDGREYPRLQRKATITPNQHAYFEEECPLFPKCVGGGFVLRMAILELLSQRRKEDTGKLVCRGRRNIEGSIHTCLLELQYRITAHYKKDANTNP